MVSDVAFVLGASIPPALGTLSGGLLAERIKLTRKQLDLLLHLAAGVVLAVVGIELLPRALEGTPGWYAALLFLAGGLLFMLLDWGTHLVSSLLRQEPVGANEEGAHVETGPWVLAVAIGIDLFTDGILVGVGAAISLGLGLLLGVGMLVVAFPEAFATLAVLRHAGVGKGPRLLVTLGLTLAIPIAAVLGFMLRDASEFIKLGLLAFTAGVLATTLIEEIIPQSHSGSERWPATALLLGGFSLFAFLTAFLE